VAPHLLKGVYPVGRAGLCRRCNDNLEHEKTNLTYGLSSGGVPLQLKRAALAK